MTGRVLWLPVDLPAVPRAADPPATPVPPVGAAAPPAPAASVGCRSASRAWPGLALVTAAAGLWLLSRGNQTSTVTRRAPDVLSAADWRLVSRALESAAKRQGWPARGFYVDQEPPPTTAAVPSERIVVRGGACPWPVWFVPFAQRRSEQSQLEPPPAVVEAFLAALAGSPATASVGPGAASGATSDSWVVELVCRAEAAGSARAAIAAAGASRGLQRMIGRHGYLLSNGWPVLLGAHVDAGARLSALLPAAPPPPAGETPAPGGQSLQIVHEDDHLLVVDKPAGLLVHPARGRGGDTLTGRVTRLFAVRARPGPVRPVGRLDRGTSGLMIFALTRHAQTNLEEQRRRGGLRRVYLAVVRPREGLELRYGERLEMATPVISPPTDAQRYLRPRPASTEAFVLGVWPGGCLIAALPRTGRTHQVRQHLAAKGLPLYGDALYGGPTQLGAGLGELRRPALHAAKVEFCHPATGARLSLGAPLPADLQALIRWLRSLNDTGYQEGVNDEQA